MNIHELKEKHPRRFDTEYQKWTEYAADYDWWESTYDWYTEQMAEYGVRVDDIEFSGFYSQGDYANWIGQIDDVKLFLEKTGGNLTQMPLYALACEPMALWIGISNGWNYYKYTPSIDLGDLEYPRYVDSGEMTQGLWAGQPMEEVAAMVDNDAVEELISKWVKDQWSNLFKMLQEEYEGVISEEAFIESCECNEVEFDDDETD